MLACLPVNQLTGEQANWLTGEQADRQTFLLLH
jgi:hypothetical protein